jgi:very-short-patch-repair endonuclease
MSTATLERKAAKSAFHEERLGVVRIDGARHSLIWAHDSERTVSVLLDRPEQGGEKLVRLIGAFWSEEGFDVVEALAADYEEHYVKRPRAERIAPRPLEPADLALPEPRP